MIAADAMIKTLAEKSRTIDCGCANERELPDGSPCRAGMCTGACIIHLPGWQGSQRAQIMNYR
jgi:hypothetical protein